MKKNSGTILIDLLLALSLSLVIVYVFSGLIQTYTKVHLDGESLQNRIGFVQLQYYLTLAHQFQIETDELRYMIINEEYVLCISNNRLIQQPGTLIFLLGIEEIEFVQEGDQIILVYLYQGKKYQRIIAYEG